MGATQSMRNIHINGFHINNMQRSSNTHFHGDPNVPSLSVDSIYRKSSALNIPFALRSIESLLGSYGQSLDGISNIAGIGLE